MAKAEHAGENSFQHRSPNSAGKRGADHPAQTDALLALADAYTRVHRSAEAIPLYERALVLMPTPAIPVRSRPPQVDVLMAIGGQWQQLGDFAQARDAYQRVVALDNHVPEAYYNLGIVFNELGQLDQSAAAYRQALSLAPDSADSRYGLAVHWKNKVVIRKRWKRIAPMPGNRERTTSAKRRSGFSCFSRRWSRQRNLRNRDLQNRVVHPQARA